MLKLHSQKFENWWQKDRPTMLKAVMMGRMFNSVIKASRREGSNYVVFENFKINISEEADLISLNDFTKTRFMACLHLFIYHKWIAQKSDEGFNVSPLVMKVVFDSDNCLTPYRFALGTGFQFLGKAIFPGTGDRMVFYVGCALMDFLSVQSEKNERYSDCLRYKTFASYALSSEMGRGNTFIAGARNLGDSNLDSFDKHGLLDAYKGHVNSVKIDFTKGGASTVIPQKWLSKADLLK